MRRSSPHRCYRANKGILAGLGPRSDQDLAFCGGRIWIGKVFGKESVLSVEFGETGGRAGCLLTRAKAM